MQGGLIAATVALYALGCVAGLLFVSGRGRAAQWHYRMFVVAGFLAQTALGLMRWQAEGQFPATELAESVWLLVWFMVLAIVVTDYVYGLPTLAPSMLPVVVLLALAGVFLGDRGSFAGATWTPVHVVAAVLGFCAFAVAATSSALYLLQERSLKAKAPSRLPSLETLDRLNFHALLFGFALLTVGLGIGIWAAVGTGGLGPAWWRDSKVIVSAAVWAFYAGLMACRMTRSLRGRPIARLTVAGFALVLAALVGADQVAPGMHARLGEQDTKTERAK